MDCPRACRHAVDRHQEAGRAVVLLDRIVEDRQVHQRDVLHAKNRVLQVRVVVEMERDDVGLKIPARRWLHAGRKPATNNPIDLGTNLLQLFTPEERVRFLRAEDARVGRLAQDRGAMRDVKRSRASLGVIDHPFGVDTVAAGNVEDVSFCRDPSFLLKQLHVVGKELQVVAIDLDWLVGGPFHDVVFVGQPCPAHVLGFREFAAADLRLRPDRRCDQPLERDAGDQNEEGFTGHRRTQATKNTDDHGKSDLLGGKSSKNITQRTDQKDGSGGDNRLFVGDRLFQQPLQNPGRPRPLKRTFLLHRRVPTPASRADSVRSCR